MKAYVFTFRCTSYIMIKIKLVDFASGVACNDIVRLAGYPLNKESLILLKDIRQPLSFPAILGKLVLLGGATGEKKSNLLLLKII